MYKGEDDIKKTAGKHIRKVKNYLRCTLKKISVVRQYFPKLCRTDRCLFPKALHPRASHTRRAEPGSGPPAPRGLGAPAAPPRCAGGPRRRGAASAPLHPHGPSASAPSVPPQEAARTVRKFNLKPRNRLTQSNLRKNGNFSVRPMPWRVCCAGAQPEDGAGSGQSHVTWRSRARACLTTSSPALFSTNSFLPWGLQGCRLAFSLPSLLPKPWWGSTGPIQSPPTGGSMVQKLSVFSVTYNTWSQDGQDNQQK